MPTLKKIECLRELTARAAAAETMEMLVFMVMPRPNGWQQTPELCEERLYRMKLARLLGNLETQHAIFTEFLTEMHVSARAPLRRLTASELEEDDELLQEILGA